MLGGREAAEEVLQRGATVRPSLVCNAERAAVFPGVFAFRSAQVHVPGAVGYEDLRPVQKRIFRVIQGEGAVIVAWVVACLGIGEGAVGGLPADIATARAPASAAAIEENHDFFRVCPAHMEAVGGAGGALCVASGVNGLPGVAIPSRGEKRRNGERATEQGAGNGLQRTHGAVASRSAAIHSTSARAPRPSPVAPKALRAG